MSKPKIRLIEKKDRPPVECCRQCPFVREMPGQPTLGHCYGLPPSAVQGKSSLLIVTPEVNMAAPACIIPYIEAAIKGKPKKNG